MQQPKLLSKVWAALGLKNDIPDSRKTGIPNESATYEDGFPQITMTPIALGGKAPSGKDMNGILNELSAHTVYQNKGGIYKFDPTFAEKIGGYSKGAVLINNELDKLFISLLDENKTDFNSQDFSGKWEVVSGVNFFVPKTQKATLHKDGIVKLYSGYDSDAEDLAATPKAIKTLKAFIDAITRNLGNYIPNSKKSSRVDSSSADDVATSAAAKTAYDKGVEAQNAANNAQRSANDGINRANNAQQTANSANDNANTRVAKSGDTMIGQLTVPKIHLTENNTGESLKLGDDAWLGDVNVGNAVGVKGQQNPEQGYIAYGAGKKRFGFDGYMFFADSALSTNHIGHGSYAQQYNVAAPFYVHQTLSVARDTYHPFIKGRVRAAGQYGAVFSLGYTTNQRQGGDGYGTGIIHLISDAGDNRLWQFGHNGEFVSAGDVITSAGRSLNSAIYREGNPHDIALSWQRDGLKVRVDNVDIGRVAFKLDLPRERLIWQGSTDNPITVNAQVNKGVLFILMDTPHGAQANRPIWFSSPIEHCHDTKIGDFNTGGTAGDYNFNTLALLSRNGTNITITPLNDGRKPRIQKVVVFG